MNVLTGSVVVSQSVITRWRPRWTGKLPFVAVSILSVIVAMQLWCNYLPRWKQLWTDVVHDRNAHLEAGLGLASDLIHGRVGEVVRDIDKAKTWPPLHDLPLVAGSLLTTGMDVRFAVVPSLLGFLMTAVFAFLLARRLSENWIGGMLAAVLVLVSPAQRAFATDVMLESLGAGLTMAALYVAVRLVQENEATDWRWLAIALSGLFFLKYNYWLLVVLALCCGLVNSSELRHHLACLPTKIPTWVQRQVCHPLNWIILILTGFGLWIKFTGGTELNLLGKSMALRSPVGIATAAYWVLLVRLVSPIRNFLNNEASDSRLKALLRWHIVPAGLWLAWPQKLASFLWVLNPSDNVGEFPATNRWEGFPFLASALSTDYHIGLWSCLMVGGLIFIGLAGWMFRQLRPGATVVVALMVLSVWLTATHPNRKSRFLHSWVPTLWVMAGVGASVAIRRSQNAWQPMAAVAGMALAAVHLPGLMSTPHAPEGGVQLHRASALTIANVYLPHLQSAQRPAILSNVPFKFLARWTYMDRYGRGIRPVTDVPGFDSNRANPENATAFQRWIESTKCDAIVYVHFPHESPWYVPVPGSQGLEQLPELCARQTQLMNLWTATCTEQVTVSVWTR